MSELGSISKELREEPEDLRHSIISGLAKLKGLDLLTGSNAFQRDQARLDSRQRAVYRKMGLDVKGEETISNTLADNITINESKGGMPGWLAALIATGALGVGAGGASLLIPKSEPITPVQPTSESAYELHLLD